MQFYMLELPANDPIICAAWYCNILNYKVITRDDANGFVLLQYAGSRLAFKRDESTQCAVRLHFQVDNLEQELLRLASLRVFPDGELKTSHEGYRRAKLHDCEGRIIILFEWIDNNMTRTDPATSSR
jgi:hypothetical protein